MTAEPPTDHRPGLTVKDVARQQLKTVPLIGVIFFSVSGGPYGLEESISSAGPGMALLALLIIPVVFGLPCALMAAELGSAMPVEGGYYFWVKAALGRFPAFLEGIWQWLNSFLDTALYPVVFADYLSQWVPWSARGHATLFSLFGGRFSIDSHWLFAVAFMIPLAWLNARGSRLVGDTSVLMMVLILLPFVVVSILGIVKLTAPGTGAVLQPFTLSGQSAPSAFGAGLGVILWNYIGWESASTVLEEVDRPQRTFSRALFVSIPLITISYLLPMLGALGSGLHRGSPEDWTDGDFAVVGGILGGHWLKLAVTIGAVLAQVGLFSSLLMSGSRVPKVLAAEGFLPAVLARDGRRGTPVAAIVVSCAIFSVFCALDFTTLIDADILTNLAAILLEFAAFLVLRSRRPELPRPFVVPGGWPVAVLITAGPVLVTGYLLQSTLTGEPGAFWLGLVVLAVGVLLYPVCRRSGRLD